MRTFILVAGALLLGACSNNSGPGVVIDGTACVDPRPQVCTMEYNPVCAVLVAGGSKQYASGCNACADDAVESYVPGECPVSE